VTASPTARPTGRPDALDFLLTRRSRPARTLTEPGPSRPELLTLLTAAARVPDHGKLEPWRFIVIEGAARFRIADAVAERARALGHDAERIEKSSSAFRQGSAVVAVVASPKPSDKIPVHEQTLSAGAVCLTLLNAALAAGWGANWLSGWAATDRPFLDGLGLAPQEWVAGFIHIGACDAAPPDRPRPDIAAIATFLER
jgi:nitroreductase